MKTKLFFFSLLFSGVCQFTTAFNVGDKISESSTFLTVDSFTFADDATNITITVNGDNVDASSHHLYIDTDNNTSTGDPDNEGADFRVENAAVHRWVNGDWVWEWHGGNLVVTDNPGVSVEFQISRSYLPLLSSGAQINTYFTNLLAFEPVVGERLPATGMESYTTITETDLQSLTITEDATTITMTILGSVIEATYDIYIDTDNNTATGLATRAGADVLLQNGLSYDSTGTGWGWAQHAVSAINSITDVAGVSRVIVLDKGILGLTVASTTFNVIYENSGGSTFALPSVSFTTGTLSLESLVLDNVSIIYKTSNSTLSINGLIQGKSKVKLFNMLGKQVLSSSFTLNGIKDISLPRLYSGIYIVRLETELGTKSKKIIL
ncbi:MAG: T9SS type A sorting domain-containing protein [Algibacter sp.]